MNAPLGDLSDIELLSDSEVNTASIGSSSNNNTQTFRPANKAKSCVYQQFSISVDEARCKKCKVVLKKKAFNLKRHIKSCNPELYRQVEAEDEKLSVVTSSKPAVANPDKSKFFVPFKLSEAVQKRQESNLAQLLSLPQMSMGIVMSPEFVNFVQNYRREFKV